MSAKKNRVFLNGKKRSDLKRLVNTSTDKARKLTRARILLLADESPSGPSRTDQEIIDSLGVCPDISSNTSAICGRRHTRSTE